MLRAVQSSHTLNFPPTWSCSELLQTTTTTTHRHTQTLQNRFCPFFYPVQEQWLCEWSTWRLLPNQLPQLYFCFCFIVHSSDHADYRWPIFLPKLQKNGGQGRALTIRQYVNVPFLFAWWARWFTLGKWQFTSLLEWELGHLPGMSWSESERLPIESEAEKRKV